MCKQKTFCMILSVSTLCTFIIKCLELYTARVSRSWVCLFTVLFLRPLEVFLQWLGFGFSESWHIAPSAPVHRQLITTFKRSPGFHSNDATTTNGKLAVEPVLYHKASLSCLLELFACFWIFQLLCLCLLPYYHPWYPSTLSLPSVCPFFLKSPPLNGGIPNILF